MQSTATLSLKKILIFIILAILVSSMSFLILPGKIYGDTLYVGGTESGNYATIQSAITAAASGDTIVVSSGTYNESLTINKNISLTGAGTVVIQAPAGLQGIVVWPGSVTVNITGITISGSNSVNGGGIENLAGIITITNCTISGNIAENIGGGICNHSGSITIINSTISGNSAVNMGGGIYNNEGDITVTNCTISGNTATHNSRGIYNWSSSKTVNAKSNWWGSATGPQNYSYNPKGTGDSINGNIDYIPWLTNPPGYAEPEDEEADGEEIIIPWVRDREMTCYQVWINEDNNFEFVFWWEYKNNNWVKIYDMQGAEVFSIDMKKGHARFEADLPDGMYTVKTFHIGFEKPIQEFLIGKP